MSFTTSAPKSTAARATPDLYVSMLITASGRRFFKSRITGSTRFRSSSSDTAWLDDDDPDDEVPAAAPASAVAAGAALTTTPGRVDSPPTSIIAAPSSSSRSAYATALAASMYSPPSENESGVTFTTPMISVRRPSSSVRDPIFH